MKKIIVTGANGQLGNELRELADNYPSYQFFFFNREDMDITSKEDVNRKMEELKPGFLINCAAYTAVDKAETDAGRAFACNSTAVGVLADACARNGVRFIHISTDYVFDGTATRPYTEEDKVSPANVYGRSKSDGEREAVAADKDALIIRTAWVYSRFGNNFVKTMLRLMKSRPELSVVADQHGSPTYAADLAQAVMQIIESGKWVPGIYHFTNEGIITWFDFATEIKKLSRSACTIHSITTEQYPTAAMRPKYSVLDKTKIQETFGLRLKNWKESLAQCLLKMQEEVGEKPEAGSRKPDVR